MVDLEDKVALVTGAASGIGRATALELAEAGATVVAADVDEKGIEETAADVEDAGGRARAVPCDVTDSADVEAAVDAALEFEGRLDVAHNNAGVAGPLAKLPDVPEEEFDRVVEVDLKGVFLGLKHQIPVMAEQGGGSIVNTASVAGLVAQQSASAYSAAKHGVVGLTRTAAAEWAREGVRVNAVCPAWVDTPMVERNVAQVPKAEEAYLERVPAGRLGEPGEVAALVAFLASDESDYLNGAAVPVDGAWTAV